MVPSAFDQMPGEAFDQYFMAFVVGTNPSFVISHHFGEDVLRKFPPTITRIFPSKIQLVFIFKNVDVSQVVTQYLVQCLLTLQLCKKLSCFSQLFHRNLKNKQRQHFVRPLNFFPF
jgi:hypothetical protein